jgi:hypothetical protein
MQAFRAALLRGSLRRLASKLVLSLPTWAHIAPRSITDLKAVCWARHAFMPSSRGRLLGTPVHCASVGRDARRHAMHLRNRSSHWHEVWRGATTWRSVPALAGLGAPKWVVQCSRAAGRGADGVASRPVRGAPAECSRVGRGRFRSAAEAAKSVLRHNRGFDRDCRGGSAKLCACTGKKRSAGRVLPKQARLEASAKRRGAGALQVTQRRTIE